MENLRKLLPKGRYAFIMIDHRLETVVLRKHYFWKLSAMNCLRFHTQLSHHFKYRVLDTKTKQEISLDGTLH